MSVGVTRLNAPPWTASIVDTGTSTYPADILYPTISHRPGDTVDVPNNAVILHDGLHLVLLDTGLPAITASDASTDTADVGADPFTGPPLLDAIGTLGFTADAVDLVVISHFHPDHLGALLHPDLAAPFPQARYFVHRDEWAYFSNEANLERHQGRVADAVRIALPRLQQANLTLIDGPLHPYPGLYLRPAPGHTPGHLTVDIGERPSLTYIADLVAHAVQLDQPDLPSGFDQNTDLAHASRTAVLADAHRLGAAIIGAHLDPGAAHVAT